MKKNLILFCLTMSLVAICSMPAQAQRKLGTHNSMTYMKPCGDAKMLAMWPFAKCQGMTYTEQYEFGVRFFDLRIRFIDGRPCFAHGEVEFCDVDAYTVLDYLNQQGGCEVNLCLENTSKIGDSQHEAFRALAKECEERYTNIEFCGGWTKYPGDHPVIYQFSGNISPRDERYKVFTQLNEGLEEAKQMKSTAVKKLGSGVKEFAQRPEGFAKQDNAAYWKEWLDDSSKENTVLMLDFPEYGAPESWVNDHKPKQEGTLQKLGKSLLKR